MFMVEFLIPFSKVLCVVGLMLLWELQDRFIDLIDWKSLKLEEVDFGI